MRRINENIHRQSLHVRNTFTGSVSTVKYELTPSLICYLVSYIMLQQSCVCFHGAVIFIAVALEPPSIKLIKSQIVSYKVFKMSLVQCRTFATVSVLQIFNTLISTHIKHQQKRRMFQTGSGQVTIKTSLMGLACIFFISSIECIVNGQLIYKELEFPFNDKYFNKYKKLGRT